jgi:hypothetical protein
MSQAAARAKQSDKTADQNLMANSTQEMTPRISGKEGNMHYRIRQQFSRKPSACIDLR